MADLEMRFDRNGLLGIVSDKDSGIVYLLRPCGEETLLSETKREFGLTDVCCNNAA